MEIYHSGTKSLTGLEIVRNLLIFCFARFLTSFRLNLLEISDFFGSSGNRPNRKALSSELQNQLSASTFSRYFANDLRSHDEVRILTACLSKCFFLRSNVWRAQSSAYVSSSVMMMLSKRMSLLIDHNSTPTAALKNLS